MEIKILVSQNVVPICILLITLLILAQSLYISLFVIHDAYRIPISEERYHIT